MNARGRKEFDERRREVLGLLIMTFGLLIFLGLISYNASDYPNSGSPDIVRNWLGLAGAWISYYLYVFSIGYACLVVPVIIFLLGWYIFFQKEFRSFYRLSFYFLMLGILLSTALAMPEVVVDEGSRHGYRLSGLMGGFIAEQLNHYLGIAGSIVVLIIGFVVVFISATSWSIREMVAGFKSEMKNITGRIGRPGRSSPVSEVKVEKSKERIKIDSMDKKSAKNQPVRAVDAAIKHERRGGSEKQAVVVERVVSGQYRFPPVDLLNQPVSSESSIDRKVLERKAHFLEEKLREFDVRGEVVGIQPGPVITRFEVRPAPGVKVSRFVGCQDDLALVMKAHRVRVVAPIPGKAAVGIEIPNQTPSIVAIRSVIESEAFRDSTARLPIALGQTIDGKPFVTDLTEMPHLLVAGATGSGKSVCLNSIIVSIIFRLEPSDVKFVLIDPKKLELSIYRNLRNHHLTVREGLDEYVVTNVNNAVAVLRSLEMEMEKRYRILARAGFRNVEDYNRALNKKRIVGGEDLKKIPLIVLVVDELADLMVTGAREVEEPIARLAQMSRAVGIHLILATQRPSVDVITGVIKANFPSRIAFQVASKADSRTIMDQNGAEKLLGRGDMLFMHPRRSELIRIHGTYISTEEVRRIVGWVAKQPKTEEWFLPGYGSKEESSGSRRSADERDELFREAARLVIRHQQGSASLLQRRLRIGYARAGRLIDQLEEAGILGPFDGSKAREVLVDESFLDRLDQIERDDLHGGQQI